METLLEWDLQWFAVINQAWSNPWLDAMMPIWRNKLFWIPLYVFIIFLVSVNFPKKATMFIVATLLTILISDMTSSQIIKKNVKRARPCQVETMATQVNVLIPCGGGYSFTSSHATNHMALATFWYLVLRQIFFGISFPLFFWAASIGFAQVYVGVHYPLDVITGILLGGLIGYFVAVIYNKVDAFRIRDLPSSPD